MPEVKLPAYLQDIVDDSANDMITSSGSAPRISIRGRQFRFIVDGDEISKQTDPIHVIILGVVPEKNMAKTFYLHGYQPGSSDPPNCSSWNGLAPDAWCGEPQSTNCRSCENNKWGSAKSISGGKAKKCKNSKRIMVINAADMKGDKKPTVYIFNVTVASLKALSELGKFLISNKVPMAAVITEIRFVDSEFPQVEFEFKSVLAKKFGEKTLELATRKEWLIGKEQNIAIDAPVKPKVQAISGGEASTPTPTDDDEPVNTNDLLEQW